MGAGAGAGAGAAGAVDPAMYEKLASVFVPEIERITRLGLAGEELKREIGKVIQSRGLPDSLLHMSTSGKNVTVAPLLPDQCQAHLSRLIDRNSFTYMICVDGSVTGDLCFELAMAMKKRHDRVLVLHSYNLNEQKEMPVHYQRDSVKSHYESMALSAGMSPKQVEDTVYLRERSDDENVRDAIMSLIAEYAEVRHAGQDDTYFLPSQTIDFCVGEC